MQKIKKDSGVTLIALIITIIVMLILAGVGLATGYQSLNSTTDNIKLADAQMIQQAIIERGYVIGLNSEDLVTVYDNEGAASNTYNRNPQPSLYIGYPLYNGAKYKLDGVTVVKNESASEGSSENTVTDYTVTEDGEDVVSLEKAIEVFERENYEGDYLILSNEVESKSYSTTYEDLYYVIDRDCLSILGVDNVADVYIVNYKTGEVFNWSMQKFTNDNIVYLPGNNGTAIEPEGVNAVTEIF